MYYFWNQATHPYQTFKNHFLFLLLFMSIKITLLGRNDFRIKSIFSSPTTVISQLLGCYDIGTEYLPDFNFLAICWCSWHNLSKTEVICIKYHNFFFKWVSKIKKMSEKRQKLLSFKKNQITLVTQGIMKNLAGQPYSSLS